MDRRRRPTPLVSRYTLVGGRRRERRRREDPGFFYVDRIRIGLAVILSLTFVFHILDAWLTLGHVARGGSELNPLMDALLRIDPGLFLVVKLSLAGVGLFILGLHQNFPYAKHAATSLFLVFLCLVGYHIYLLGLN
jgi:hypothetical protein